MKTKFIKPEIKDEVITVRVTSEEKKKLIDKFGCISAAIRFLIGEIK